ncbi:hypothetical protein KIW84_055465 [Lathyrus oleraceus]|uniref:Uncharacterized protein n=1 Tax=Pisum sativum TaxID=3888 RepID=A0A9D5AIK8_PEA|nr:hypothetical protein KIW84_055465 [Pisum sativum]
MLFRLRNWVFSLLRLLSTTITLVLRSFSLPHRRRRCRLFLLLRSRSQSYLRPPSLFTFFSIVTVTLKGKRALYGVHEHLVVSTDKMANQDDTHDASGSRNNVEKEIKRGLTVMKSIIRARDKGEKFEVHWSAEDQLIEPNGSMLASYIGSLVRQHIPITCDNWRSPELKVGKEKIWSEIQRSFHIDESRQKYCIQLAGKRL